MKHISTLIVWLVVSAGFPLYADARPFLLGISGGSASGKTTLARELCSRLTMAHTGVRMCLLSQDRYFDHSRIPKEHYFVAPAELAGQPNFDHPTAINLSLMIEDLKRYSDWKSSGVQVPIEPWNRERRKMDSEHLGPCDVILVEGIHTFDDSMVEYYDLKIFVDAPRELRLSRRMLRDQEERGTSAEETRLFFDHIVDPMHEVHVQPKSRVADIVVSGVDVREEKLLSYLVDRISEKVDGYLQILGPVI